MDFKFIFSKLLVLEIDDENKCIGFIEWFIIVRIFVYKIRILKSSSQGVLSKLIITLSIPIIVNSDSCFQKYSFFMFVIIINKFRINIVNFIIKVFKILN